MLGDVLILYELAAVRSGKRSCAKHVPLNEETLDAVVTTSSRRFAQDRPKSGICKMRLSKRYIWRFCETQKCAQASARVRYMAADELRKIRGEDACRSLPETE